jgi:hypothetical protein
MIYRNARSFILQSQQDFKQPPHDSWAFNHIQPTPQLRFAKLYVGSWWLISALYKPRHILGGSPHLGGAESYRNHPTPTSIAERLIRRRLQSKRSCKVNESSWAMQVTRDHGIPMDPRDMVCIQAPKFW